MIVTLLIAYVFLTVIYSLAQAIENLRAKPGDLYWAPVWWIALTWPFWIVVIAADLPIPGMYRRRRCNGSNATTNGNSGTTQNPLPKERT